MEDIDLSRPGTELFPENDIQQYSNYTDVNDDHVVDDPLETGAYKQDVAGQENLSEQQLNFRALREEVAKMKQEKEYWKGQAEAFSKMSSRVDEKVHSSQQDAFSALDWDDSQDVKKAFDVMRQENSKLRQEINDVLIAIDTKSKRQDWNQLVTQHVPQLTSTNPIFAEMIQNASNPYEAAYALAQLNARASQPQAQSFQQSNINGQRAVQNAQKPQTLASVGGHGQLSAADYYATMSDEDFMKLAARNLANI